MPTLEDIEQEQLLDILRPLKEGQSVDLPSLLPALSQDQPLQAICTKCEDGSYWELDLFWFGITVGQVTAQYREETDDLILEVL